MHLAGSMVGFAARPKRPRCCGKSRTAGPAAAGTEIGRSGAELVERVEQPGQQWDPLPTPAGPRTGVPAARPAGAFFPRRMGMSWAACDGWSWEPEGVITVAQGCHIGSLSACRPGCWLHLGQAGPVPAGYREPERRLASCTWPRQERRRTSAGRARSLSARRPGCWLHLGPAGAPQGQCAQRQLSARPRHLAWGGRVHDIASWSRPSGRTSQHQVSDDLRLFFQVPWPEARAPRAQTRRRTPGART